jgi:hypothetical protein
LVYDATFWVDLHHGLIETGEERNLDLPEFLLSPLGIEFARKRSAPILSARNESVKGPHLVLHWTMRRLVLHFHALAGDVEFPTAMNAPQAAFFVAAVKHRRKTMRAISIDQPDIAVRIAKGD